MDSATAEYSLTQKNCTAASRATTLMLCIAVTFLGGGLRFYGLGKWSFANDELATFIEADRLFGVQEGSESTIYDVLPRLIPGSYLILESGYRLFGRDEFGSRTLPAIFGTFHVTIVFLLGTRLHGRTFGLILSTMVALWPEHIFHSQQNRFYIFAMCGSTLAFLVAGLGLQAGSRKCLIAALAIATVTVTTHTLATFLVPLLYLSILASLFLARLRVSRRFLVNGFSLVALVAVYVLVYARPHVRDHWSGGSGWMYSPAHALMTIPGTLGWGLMILAASGALLLISNRQSQHVFALICTVAVLPFTLVLPYIINFHPEYLMLIIFPAMYSAAWFVHFVFQQLWEHSRAAASAVVGLVALLNFPSLVSHYVDGSRPDFRSASNFLRSNAADSDTITAISIGNIRHYSPELPRTQVIDPASPITSISEAVSGSGTTWIVVESGRSGLEPSLQKWLNLTCRLERTIQRQRYDYYINRIDIFSTDSKRLRASREGASRIYQKDGATWFQAG